MEEEKQANGYHSVCIDTRGRDGGLTLLWEKDVTISSLSQSSNHIDVVVSGDGNDAEWRFTSRYAGGAPTNDDRVWAPRHRQSKREFDTVGLKCPDVGLYKLNFDAAKLSDWGYGLGVVARDSEGEWLRRLLRKGKVFLGSEVEDALACVYALQRAQRQGFRNVIMEGDCLSLISKLKKKQHLASEISLLIDDILRLSSHFEFCAFTFVKREGNKVAYTLAHPQAYVLGS
ncbi:hypothetical protein Cgig2_007507 [Carnegiea gigantea]|uniref:RNase H type-1 domain-containing protein n=1 Tax=Carnegiea gigantea TaxID=171969 RepID=A0A9Q1JUC0_9CARY|nr:hypothetical protein Cgig2_007507 [Carnegiea gigantea]